MTICLLIANDTRFFQSMLSSPVFVVQEVIDRGNEPIHMYEYFDVGKVTEFNFGSWVSCIRDNDLNCLNGIGRDMVRPISRSLKLISREH